MAYNYNSDWHDYPPRWEEWLAETAAAREAGAKVILTDDLSRHIANQKEFLSCMAIPLANSFLEILYKGGQDYPKEFKLDRERDESLRAFENIFLHMSEPKPTLQKYIYNIYHKALYDYAERIKWETKPVRERHKDWAIGTKEYRRLWGKYQELEENYNQLKYDYEILLAHTKQPGKD